MAIARPGAPRLPARDMLLEPARLPASWLAYTPLQAVVIGPREWAVLDSAQRSALLTWVAAGGTIVVVDTGLGTLFPDAGTRPLPGEDGVAAHLFGRIVLRDAAAVDTNGLQRAIDDGRRRAAPEWTLPLAAGAPPAGRSPIPGVHGVPARAYLGLLAIFSLVIGPVNHWLLRRRGQQALVVLTTPLIAGAFIVLIGGYVIVFEGFGIRGHAVSLTILDQARSQAATRATVSLYAAGRAPAGGLQFPHELAVFPAVRASGSQLPDRRIDLTRAQRFTAGLIEPRVSSHFETVYVRTARERLSIRREAATLTVVNGLGTAVSRLLYRIGGRAYTVAGPLAPGGSAALEASSLTPADLLPAGDPALAPYEQFLRAQPDDSYVAVLERSPFLEPGVAEVDERGSVHLVLGLGVTP